MTLPRDYDTWRLSGPEEPDEPKMVEYENERGEWLRDRRDGL